MAVSDAAAWTAVLVSVASIGKQGYDLITKRKTERDEVQKALDKSPLVKQQLELGNVGDAVKFLNEIIVSQSDHIKAQDARIKHLEDRNEALEAEASSLETKLREAERRIQHLEEVNK